MPVTNATTIAANGGRITTQDRRTTNTAALIGLFCALFGLFVPAIVFGAIGWRETDRRPNEDGGWIAFWAVILGGVEVLLGAIALTVFLISLT